MNDASGKGAQIKQQKIENLCKAKPKKRTRERKKATKMLHFSNVLLALLRSSFVLAAFF